ncbi:cytochrome P450 [Xylaria flabelliformis]|nr:cytochrome P450 [Xylaria flabelliformis]
MLVPIPYAFVSGTLALCHEYLSRHSLAKYDELLQLPASLFWGNLKTLSMTSNLQWVGRHPDHGFLELLRSSNHPPLVFFGSQPLGKPLLVVTSHEVLEQLSMSTGLFSHVSARSLGMASVLRRLNGTASAHLGFDENWDVMQKKLRDAFACQQLQAISPLVVEKIQIFITEIDVYATSGALFRLLPLAQDLLLDILSVRVLGLDVCAQGEVPQRFASDLRELLHGFYGFTSSTPSWLIPMIRLRRRYLRRSIRMATSSQIHNVSETLDQSISIIDDSQNAQSVLLEILRHNSAALTALPHISGHLDAFLVSSRDTTAVTLVWAIYELSLNPHALKRLREEANTAFDRRNDAAEICSALVSQGINSQDLLQMLPYTSAVVCETLRLYPPDVEFRHIEENSSLTVHDSSTGETHSLRGCDAYLCMSALGRDPKVYGEFAEAFSPERWLYQSVAHSTQPASRSRLKMDLQGAIYYPGIAVTDVILTLVLLSRRYAFHKRGPGEVTMDINHEPMLDEQTGRHVVNKELYKVLGVASEPFDGMEVQVELI